VPRSLQDPRRRIAGSYDAVAAAALHATSALAVGDLSTYDAEWTRLETALGDVRTARLDAESALLQ
jgi:hypothetical protein